MKDRQCLAASSQQLPTGGNRTLLDKGTLATERRWAALDPYDASACIQHLLIHGYKTIGGIGRPHYKKAFRDLSHVPVYSFGGMFAGVLQDSLGGDQAGTLIAEGINHGSFLFPPIVFHHVRPGLVPALVHLETHMDDRSRYANFQLDKKGWSALGFDFDRSLLTRLCVATVAGLANDAETHLSGVASIAVGAFHLLKRTAGYRYENGEPLQRTAPFAKIEGVPVVPPPDRQTRIVYVNREEIIHPQSEITYTESGTPKSPHNRAGSWCTSKLGKEFWRKPAKVHGGAKENPINIVRLANPILEKVRQQ